VLVVALTVETPAGRRSPRSCSRSRRSPDGLDGYIARRASRSPPSGKVMDPVADKLMIAAALISLVSLDRLAGVGRHGDHRARVRRERAADRGRPAGGS
jgi:CDP-diacylglycerol--glycerol-3-phosphate 3-phosphatidyltransferase